MAIATRPGDPPSSAQSPSESGAHLATSGFSTRLRTWSRAHALFMTCLTLAALLRLLVTVAYPPALEFFGIRRDLLYRNGRVREVQRGKFQVEPNLFGLTSDDFLKTVGFQLACMRNDAFDAFKF